MKKYKIIYVDPPWAFNNKNTGGSMTAGACQKYDVMNIKDICNLNVNSICEDDCVLFMWWVGAMPEEAISVVKAWGFKVKTMTGFNWVKLTSKNNLFFGMGFWTRAGSENCLIATKGKIRPILHNIRSVNLCKIEKHSKKPDIFRKLIVELIGDLPRIELFAREKSEGWDSIGFDIDGTLIQDDIEKLNNN